MLKNLSKLMVLLLVLGLVTTGCAQADNDGAEQENNEEPVELLVYAGAGLKMAMEQIKPAFEDLENVTINYIYAGSGQLLAQMETTEKGDVFIVGSEATYDIAKEKGLTGDSQLVAHHTPALAVEKGNPKGIESLKDLTKEGLRVALGDAESNAVGKTAAKIIEKNGLEAIYDNVVTTTATVNELIVVISTGEADVAIVTEDSLRFSEDLDMVVIPESENIDQLIPVGPLKSSTNPELAQKLVDFIASDAGKAIFEKAGFRILE